MNAFQQAKKSEQLTWAYQLWTLAAKDPSISEGHKKQCLQSAQSIKMELEDGVPRCTCCLFPYSQCRAMTRPCPPLRSNHHVR